MNKVLKPRMTRIVFNLLYCLAATSLIFFSTESVAEDLPSFKSSVYIVSASKIPQQRFKVPWNTSVLTKEDIKAIGAENLAEAVQFLAGVDVKRTGQSGAQSTIKLRGASFQQVLILLNGARLNSPLLGGAQVEDVLLSDVERIEVVRSPISAVYGADAAGGIVNIITQKAEDKKAVDLELSYGSYIRPKIALSHGASLGAFRYYVSAGSLYDEGFRNNSDYKATDGLINLGWDNLLGSWDLTVGQYTAAKGVPGVPSAEANPTSSSTPGDRQYDWRTFYDLGYSASLLGENNFKIRGYQNALKQQTHIYNFTGSVFADTEYLAREKVLEASHSLDIFNHQFLYGADYREDWGRSDYAGEHTINNTGVFVEDQFSFGSQLHFTLGARGDRHSVIGDNLSPRVGLVYSPWEEVFIKSSLAYAYRAPTLNDLYWSDPVWLMYGSTSLESENTRSAEISLERRLGKDSYASVTYYDSAITNLILWNYNAGTYTTRAENLDSARITGIEFDYVQKFYQNLSAFLNYTLQDAKNTSQNSGKWLPYAAQSKYNVGLTYKGEKYSSSINLRFVGSRYTNTANTEANKLPAYTLVNLSVSKKLFGFDLTGYVDNLFDQVYYESIGYHPVSYAVMKYPMPGRTYRLQLGVKF